MNAAGRRPALMQHLKCPRFPASGNWDWLLLTCLCKLLCLPLAMDDIADQPASQPPTHRNGRLHICQADVAVVNNLCNKVFMLWIVGWPTAMHFGKAVQCTRILEECAPAAHVS